MQSILFVKAQGWERMLQASRGVTKTLANLMFSSSCRSASGSEAGGRSTRSRLADVMEETKGGGMPRASGGTRQPDIVPDASPAVWLEFWATHGDARSSRASQHRAHQYAAPGSVIDRPVAAACMRSRHTSQTLPGSCLHPTTEGAFSPRMESRLFELCCKSISIISTGR